ncbi:PREDICTED: CCR4-NOT transcription complex subunit 1 [Ipomoea nil]|uniref:CCR4-NOT transcription complex subunit 1 n=1 Tax=Ipomoea nil TaxID=35883 RepID=UPI0009008ECF|nr:PREDICTED: CCR4-NOT transcription complex subunit 1 [Ipomoea nil]
MIPFASTTSSQIRYLLQSLKDSNSDSVFQELCQFATYGIEGRILLLGTIFDHLSIYGKDLKNMQFDAVYASIFKYILDKPSFSTVFCVSIRGVTINEEFLENLCNALRLSVSEKIEVGLALSDSENADVKMCGKSYCMGQIVELCSNQMSFDSVEHIQSILLLINQSEGLSKHVDLFMHMLSLVQSKGGSQFILSPLLSDELREVNFWRNFDDFNEESEDDFDALLMEMEKEMSMADTMKELGYGCTANALQCKEILSLFLPLTEITVARILGMIVRTYSGLEDNQNIFSTFRAALGSTTVYDLPSPSSWNGDVLIDAIKELAPGLNWGTVMKNLDHEGFYVLNEPAFAFLMSMYKCACQDPFPLQAVCGSIWKNSEGQLSFLSHAVVAPPEVFTFAHSGRQMAYVDAVNDHKFQHGHSNHAWLCLDLLEVLCQLAERGHANSVRSILEHPLTHCPELLLLGLSHINTVYNLLQHEISSTVFPMILRNAPGMGMIHYLWHVNPSILVRGFVDAVTIDADNISRVLEACQELKILSPVLDMLPSNVGIRLAAVASMKGLIDLDKWLNTNLSTYKDKFYEECLKFLKEVQLGVQDISTNCFHLPNTLLNIYMEASTMFIKLLQSHTGLISSHYLSDELEKINMTYVNSNPRLKTVGASNSSTSDAHADDIEAEVNSYFQQMFHEERSVESIIQMLARFKESSDKREQAVFEFMIANLFEEYKFFSKYPDKQLTIAAVLFGSLIKHQLVTHLTLGIALRAVLDALRKPADSKMFSFGTKALDQFRERLIEWPQYCNHILQISHLRVNHLDIVLYIERALARISSAHSESDIGNNAVADQFHGIIQSSTSNVESSTFALTGPISSQPSGLQLAPPVQLPPRQQSTLDERKISTIPSHMKTLSSTSQAVGVPSSDASNIPKSQSALNSAAAHTSSPGFTRPNRTNSTRFGSALNIETLVAAAERRETPIEAPASEVQDKVSFIINNLAIQNVDAKAKEFSEILKEQYYPWFAQYMVMKRASIEQNFHDLYLKFLDKVNSKALYKEVVQATYENCKVLLGSELIKSSSEERSLLKNLGSWLGKITIGRNQVLRAREIDPKSLIIEAYEKGLMIAVIPFTSKILEPCQSSLAYQPPNPWTMGILGLLAEIYAMPNLKMNLKFDIEVLFKNLGVDLKDVAPTSLLKDRVREVEGNPDFSNKDAGSSQSQIVTDVKSGLVSTLNQVELPLEAATSSHPGGHSRILSQYAAPLHLPSATLMEEEKLVALVDQHQIPSGQGIIPGQTPFSVSQLPTPTSNIEQQVIINPRLRALGMHVHFQSVLPIAMDRAIKEIVTSIVHRSVSIATQTTKELVLKDYAMESDETRIRNAAHLMVASLAGSLAHVTCKEPLRGSISSQLRSTLQGLSISSELLEQAVQLVTNDNLDLGCALIEQAATEKAIQTIDETIAQQLAIRKHRDGPTFFDSGVYTPGHMGVLPEALRPKPGRLSHSQQRVYEDFVRLPLQNQSGQSSNTLPVGPSPSPSSSGLSRAYVAGSGQMNPAIYSAGLVNAGISSVPQPLDIVSEEIDTSSSQLHSASSPNNGMGDGGFENETIAPLSSASTAELQPVEQSNVVKEPGLSVQPPNSTPTSERHGSSISEPLLNTGDALDKYQIVSEKLENLVSTDAKEAEIQGIIAEVPAIILRCISRDEAALAVAQKVFKGLYENASNTVRVNAHLAILAAIRDVSKLVVKELTSWVTYSDEERKFNKDITVGLIRSELLNLAEYNVHMAKLIDAGRNKPATEFAISLIQTLVMSDSRVISELQNLLDALAKLAARPGSPESLRQLVEIAKNPSVNASALSGFTSGKEDNMKQQPKDKKASVLLQAGRDDTGSDSVEPDPAGFREQVSMLFAEWYRICELPGASESAYAHYVIQLHQSGLLKGDDASDRFFRLLMELSVSHCLSSEVISSGPSQSHLVPLSFLAIDIYAKLVYSVLKFYPVDQGVSKLSLLPKVLAVTVKFIQKDSEEKKISFNPRPYFRLFINWLLDFCSLEPVFDGANFQVLTALANAFHALQPLKVPGFSFAWLELVSHRSFMPKLLTANAQKGWPYFQRLLVDLFQFMEPFLRNAELGEAVHFLYKGTLRVLLVLLHDYPEFLCDYHFSFCDVIPPSCIQMRNIILSAFPRNMRLPDPSTPNLKIDLLAEISQSPRILSEVDAALKTKQIKSDIDEYLKTRQQGSLFLTELKQKVLLSPTESARAGTRYNVPLINSLVLYVGMLAIQQLQARTAAHSQSMASSGVSYPVYLVGAALDIFQSFIMDLDTEGRYLFLNAVANQLRYPNNHTHYFSFILLYLFSESNQEVIQEQITRVLLERLIVNRPHPWGLLITFIELIKNPRYNFWSRSFTRCAPEIEKLFESVSRSCGGPKPVDDSVVSGGIPDNMH